MNGERLQAQTMSAAALEWTRRRLLRATTGSVVGIGLGHQALQRALAQELPTCNFNLLVLSKKLGGATIDSFDCEECRCDGKESFLISFTAELFLAPNLDCDETDALIPAGSTLQVSALHFLRRKGLAGTTVGSFVIDPGAQLIDPSGVVLAQVDQLEGTLGFDSRAGQPSTGRCEHFPNGAGLLKLTGMDGTALERCSVVATFETVVDLDPQELCKPWNDWVLWVDGILSCDFCPAP